MKKIYLSLFSLLILAAMVLSNTGCKSDKPVIPDSLLNGVPAAGKFSVKINGTLKTATLSGATYYQGNATQNSVQIFGSLGDKEGIQVGLTNVKTGTFNLKDSNGGASIIYIEDSLDPNSSYADYELGTITITTFNDKVIKGTFSGTVTNLFGGNTLTKIITEGKFECKLMIIK